MIRRREPHPEHRRGQAVDGEGMEYAVAKGEQRGRVAGDRGTDDVEEPLVAIRRPQALGQVDGDSLKCTPGVHR